MPFYGTMNDINEKTKSDTDSEKNDFDFSSVHKHKHNEPNSANTVTNHKVPLVLVHHEESDFSKRQEELELQHIQRLERLKLLFRKKESQSSNDMKEKQRNDKIDSENDNKSSLSQILSTHLQPTQTQIQTQIQAQEQIDINPKSPQPSFTETETEYWPGQDTLSSPITSQSQKDVGGFSKVTTLSSLTHTTEDSIESRGNLSLQKNNSAHCEVDVFQPAKARDKAVSRQKIDDITDTNKKSSQNNTRDQQQLPQQAVPLSPHSQNKRKKLKNDFSTYCQLQKLLKKMYSIQRNLSSIIVVSAPTETNETKQKRKQNAQKILQLCEMASAELLEDIQTNFNLREFSKGDFSEKDSSIDSIPLQYQCYFDFYKQLEKVHVRLSHS